MEINNNYSAQNFGMALRIRKGAKKGLENCAMETIERLQKAGADLKDTKFYHVEVGDDLSAKITADKDAYFGLFPRRGDGYAALKYGEQKNGGQIVPDDRIIMIENDGGTIAGVGRYVPYGETKPFFNTWGIVGPYNTVEDVSKLSKIAKILDDTAVERYKCSAAAINDKQQEQVSKAVGNLLDTFGV